MIRCISLAPFIAGTIAAVASPTTVGAEILTLVCTLKGETNTLRIDLDRRIAISASGNEMPAVVSEAEIRFRFAPQPQYAIFDYKVDRLSGTYTEEKHGSAGYQFSRGECHKGERKF